MNDAEILERLTTVGQLLAAICDYLAQDELDPEPVDRDLDEVRSLLQTLPDLRQSSSLIRIALERIAALHVESLSLAQKHRERVATALKQFDHGAVALRHYDRASGANPRFIDRRQ